MNIIIPLGGIGKRFSDEGYTQPKPLIPVMGIPMIQRLLLGLQTTPKDNVIIIYNKELRNWAFSELIKDIGINGKLHFYEVIAPTNGAVHTLHTYLSTIDCSQLNDAGRTVLFDCDTFYEESINILERVRALPDTCNGVVCFEYFGKQPLYSFIEVDVDRVVAIKEKQMISNIANTGCYIFRSMEELKQYSEKVINNGGEGELYTSAIINLMLIDGALFKSILITDNEFHCVGTPEQLKQYCIGHIKQPTIKQRFCFDIDHTLMCCANKDYAHPSPIVKNIAFLRYLKNLGHTIILHTARRMKTHGGDVGKVVRDIGATTLATLEELKIPYDEIYFGKPYADYYIDDKAINSNADLEKDTGFYMNHVPERGFNCIKTEQIDVIVKTGPSNVIRGEVFYYKNIPQAVSHMFPCFFGGDNTRYKIEKIAGTNMSFSLAKGQLQPRHLLHVLESIEKLHKIVPQNEDEIADLVYKHYKVRIVARTNNIHPQSLQIVTLLDQFFEWYSKTKGAKLGMIHGDPVLSNILLANGVCRFIDMRGILCDTETIYGDIMYDYAKLYQSLLGYDEIMHDTYLPNAVTASNRQLLLDHIQINYGIKYTYIVKAIAISHIFTLLPLHPIDKARLYANLISIAELSNIVEECCRN